MLPETEFHKLGQPSIMVIANGRVYHPANQQPSASNFLAAEGLIFPLKRAETLAELEARYLNKNKKVIQDLVARQSAQLSELHLKEVEETLKKREDLLYFFNEVCSWYDTNVNQNTNSPVNFFISQPQSQQQIDVKLDHLMPQLINFNCAIINGRVFPLIPATNNATIFVNVDNIDYEITTGVTTIDEIEKDFFSGLERKIQLQAFAEFEKGKSNLKQINKLEEEIKSMEVIAGMKKYTHSYEFGNIGFDFTSGLVFWTINPHYNLTSEKNYGEGESAVSLPLVNKKLEPVYRFVERSGRKQPFVPHPHTNCYGSALNMKNFDDSNPNSKSDKLHCLATCARMVEEEKRFFQAPAASSDDSGSYQ